MALFSLKANILSRLYEWCHAANTRPQQPRTPVGPGVPTGWPQELPLQEQEQSAHHGACAAIAARAGAVYSTTVARAAITARTHEVRSTPTAEMPLQEPVQCTPPAIATFAAAVMSPLTVMTSANSSHSLTLRKDGSLMPQGGSPTSTRGVACASEA